MHAAVKHIICLISVIFMTCNLHGQDTGSGSFDWDAELNRYELECERCMALKERVNAGDNVSRKEAQTLIDDFLTRNRAIKANLPLLSNRQIQRFEAVNIWFRTGKKPLVLTAPLTHVCQVSSEPSGSAESSGCSELVLSLPDYTPCPSMSEVNTFPNERNKWTALLTYSIKTSVYGAMAGFQHGRWGGYVKPKTNFRFKEAGYSCLSSGSLGNGSAFWASGKSVRSITSITAGPVVGISRWADFYAGAGYGHDILLWEDIDGNWAEVRDHSYKGIVAEAGLLFSVRQLTFGIGCSTMKFRKSYLELCIGFNLTNR